MSMDRLLETIRTFDGILELAPAAAFTLGLALHELATNAAKYGALSTPAGAVRVTWRVETGRGGARHLHLRWAESGGPPVAEPMRRGFGSRLIAGSMRHELAGEVRFDFARSGLVCTITAPLPADAPVAVSAVA